MPTPTITPKTASVHGKPVAIHRAVAPRRTTAKASRQYRRALPAAAVLLPCLPASGRGGLRPGVNLDSNAGLLDLLES